MGFVRHHCHSVYSKRDGMLKIQDMFAEAAKAGETFSLTDHGSIGGWIECLTEAKKHNIRPILGCEFYINPDREELMSVLNQLDQVKEAKTALEPKMSHDPDPVEEGWEETAVQETDDAALKSRRDLLAKYEHIVVLARNNLGAMNIIKLNNLAYTYGFYRKPMLSYHELFNCVDRDEKGDDGLFITSACLGSGINRAILAGNMAEAEKSALMFKKRFGDYYMLEVQSNGTPEQTQVNTAVVEMGKKLGIKVCIGIDAHYISQESADTHQDLLLLQNKNKKSEINETVPSLIIRDRNGTEKAGRLVKGEFRKIPFDELKVGQVIGKGATQVVVAKKERKPKVYMFTTNLVFYKSEAQVRKEIPKVHPELVPYLDEICENNKLMDTMFETIELDSSIKLPHTDNGRKALTAMVAAAMKEKGFNTQKYIDRVKHELNIICANGFEDYFIILADILKHVREMNIPMGSARGSAGSSLVAHLLGIHRINPLEKRWGKMPFGRFMDEAVNANKIVVEGDNGESFEMIENANVSIMRNGEQMIVAAKDMVVGDTFIEVIQKEPKK